MSKTTAPTLSISAWQMIQSMLDGVMIIGPRGEVIAVNDAFCEITGYPLSELLGRRPRLVRSDRRGRARDDRLWAAVLRTGSWRGEVCNRRKNGEVYPEWLTVSAINDDRGRARFYLAVFRDISSPKLNEERLKRLAQYDPLTGLPNRPLFQERLKRELCSRRPGGRLAVLFLDLDHFKDVNDRWGHAAGDAFLQAVGARLRGCVRRTDTVARWAGDEFVVLLNPVSGRRDAARVARKILRILRRPFSFHGRRTRASASIGGCVLEGDASPSRLIAMADQAMYAVKERGRDDFGFWTRPAPLRLDAGSRHRRRRGAGSAIIRHGRL